MSIADTETRWRAATIAEGDGDDTGAGDRAEGTAESREYRALIDRAELGAIFAATIEHRNTDGAEAELQTHHNIAANQIPLGLMRVEHRAVSPAPTNTGVSEQPVIAAVFANSVASFLGVDQPTVPSGDAIFPVITSRASVKAS